MDTPLSSPKRTRAARTLHGLFRERILRTSDPSHPLRPAGRASAALRAWNRAGWAGLWIGLVEVGLLLTLHATIAETAIGNFQLSKHFPWMLPLVQLGLFAAAGLPLAVLAAIRRERADRAVWGTLAALAGFSLLALIDGLYAVGSAVLAAGFAVKVSKGLAKRTQGIDRQMRWSWPLGLAILAGLGWWCYDRTALAEGRAMARIEKAHERLSAPGAGQAPAARTAKNVLLVVMDTVRADHLSLYGYPRPTTPNLDRLARRGVAYTQARSMAPWTFPSHAGMLTGRWPHELGILDPVPLNNRYPTLGEFLSSQGYATAGVVANTFYCNSWFGLGRGFAHYEDDYESKRIVSTAAALNCPALGRFLVRTLGLFPDAREGTSVVPKTGPEINDGLLHWLDQRPAHLPFFAFVNYMDAHDPYVACHPDGGHFGLTPSNPGEHHLIRAWHRLEKDYVEPHALQIVLDAYDDSLRALDAHLGRLFDQLERRGLMDDTLIVITSDHGEAFGEHGLYLHAKSVYKEVTHVPLIILDPSRPVDESNPARVDRPVTLGDLPATIVDRLGLSAGSPFPGHSLARFWTGASDPRSLVPDHPILMQAATRTAVASDANRPPAQRGPLSGLLVDRVSYHRDALGNEELYDRASDPGETKNLLHDPHFAQPLNQARTTLDQLLRKP